VTKNILRSDIIFISCRLTALLLYSRYFMLGLLYVIQNSEMVLIQWIISKFNDFFPFTPSVFSIRWLFSTLLIQKRIQGLLGLLTLFKDYTFNCRIVYVTVNFPSIQIPILLFSSWVSKGVGYAVDPAMLLGRVIFKAILYIYIRPTLNLKSCHEKSVFRAWTGRDGASLYSWLRRPVS